MRSFLLSVFLGALVLAFAGCADGTLGQGPGATGNLTASVVVAPGIDITEINYEITGPAGLDLTGVITVTKVPVTAIIAGIPAGTGYTIKLFTTDGVCSGSSPFDVTAGQVTSVSVQIQCSSTPDRGSIDINGDFVLCPTLTSAVAAPSHVDLNGTIQVSANAKDLGTAGLTYVCQDHLYV
jgi:hypothetical protein